MSHNPISDVIDFLLRLDWTTVIFLAACLRPLLGLHRRVANPQSVVRPLQCRKRVALDLFFLLVVPLVFAVHRHGRSLGLDVPIVGRWKGSRTLSGFWWLKQPNEFPTTETKPG